MQHEGVDLVVVGAGVAGLLAAVEAAASGVGRVTVLDPHPPGGRARVDAREGFVLNRGPRALYVGGPAERLLRTHGVAVDTGGPPRGHRPAAWHRGRLHALPVGLGSAVTTSLLTPREKLQTTGLLAALARASRRPADLDDRSLADWLDGRGVSGTPRQLVEAMARVATYADAPEVLPAGQALAQVVAAATSGVRYLDGGFGALVDGLVDRAGEIGVSIDRRGVRHVTPATPAGGVVVSLDDGSTVVAAAVIIAAGTPATAARLLGRTPSQLGAVGPAAQVACLELGLTTGPDHSFVLGVDEPLYLSEHTPPAALAPPGHHVVHVMRYLRPGEQVDDPEVRAQLWGLAAAAGVRDDHVVVERFLARMTVTGSLPVVAGDGGAARAPVDQGPGIALAGDWVGPEALLLDAAAASAVAAVERCRARSATMVGA
jgi:phytoene dehydrogenase-like protein